MKLELNHWGKKTVKNTNTSLLKKEKRKFKKNLETNDHENTMVHKTCGMQQMQF